MFYKPEFFVYLMLLPVICLIVLPAMLSATRVIIGTVKTSEAPEIGTQFEQEALAKA